MAIKITLITVTYNAEKVLPVTLRSVLSQDYPHIEHIIVDGASTDRTLSICHEYDLLSHERSNGHDIRVVSEPDRGIYDAMNKGLQQATGHYVCFLNAGDWLPSYATISNIAQAVSKACHATDADDTTPDAGSTPAADPDSATEKLPAVLYGDTDIVDEKGQFLSHRRLSPPRHLSWQSFRSGMTVCHQAFYARTDLARRTPYDLQYRFSADFDWCIRVMKAAAAEGAQLLNTRLTLANYQKEGTTTKNHRASLKERYRIMQKHYGCLTTALLHIWFVVRAFIK